MDARILLVEDDDDLRAAMAEALAADGHRVHARTTAGRLSKPSRRQRTMSCSWMWRWVQDRTASRSAVASADRTLMST